MKTLIIFIITVMMTATLAYGDDLRRITLQTNDIIYDPFSRKIYASVPSNAGSIGNSIISIDPYTGSIGPPVFIGSEPNKLAISDNGQYLYVGLDGAAAVRRFDIGTQTAGLQFSLGNDPYTGALFVDDMEVLPGSPESIAVSRKNSGFSPRHEGVAIYDNGIQRLVSTPDHTGSNVIEFSNSASLLYGYNNEASEFGVRRMSVNSSGVSVQDVTNSIISGYNVDIKFDNDLIYATSGRVINPEAMTIVGTFSGIGSGTLVKPDSRVGRVFFLTGTGSTRSLLGFDLYTFLPIGSLAIQDVSGTPSSLIRWGSRGLAFRTSTTLFLVRTALIPDPKVDFDRDSKTDLSVYDVANGWWFNRRSSNGSYWFDAIGVGGGPGWKPVPGDYDGDGKTDLAVYDTVNGWWLFHYSSGTWNYDHVGQGGVDFTAVPGDYDGDGKTDLAVYNIANGDWFFKYSSGTYQYDNLGGSEWIPVPGDYDGDGKTDVAVYNQTEGYWYFHYSSDGNYGFDAIGVGGGPGWKSVPGDYDGDGKTDLAVYDTVYGWWLFHYSAGGYYYDHIGKGGTGYIAVPGDYDGDGKTDLAVYNIANGDWFFKYSWFGNYGYSSLGGPGMVPVNQSYLFGSE